MKNIKLTIIGVATLTLALVLNLRYALDDYGLRNGKLHVEVLAQASNSGGFGGGSSGGTGATSSWGTFTFGGVTYDTEYHYYNEIGSKWCPEIRKCTKQQGFDMGFVDLDIYEGKMVVCTTGDGNCLQNSHCI